MPEDEIDHGPSFEWSTPLGAVVALAAGGVVMVAAALLLGLDAPGRFLAVLAALGMFVLAFLGGRQRPKLAIVQDGPVPALAATRLTGDGSTGATASNGSGSSRTPGWAGGCRCSRSTPSTPTAPSAC